MSIRLTQIDKHAIIASIMQDVPKEDFDEQLRACLVEARLQALPAIMRRVWEDVELRGFIGVSYDHECGLFGVPFDGVNISPQAREQIQNLQGKRLEQKRKSSDLAEKLKASFASVRTTKQFIDRFPEFEKYLPVYIKQSQAENLPATANLLADLTAAGWPKAA